jgi:hypothetical protein
MAYQNIVFIQNEETDTDDGIEQDTALRILHHKTDDSVLWECPTQESVNAAVDYLLLWDTGESDIYGRYDISQSSGSDRREVVTKWDRTFVLTYNVDLSYIGLEELVNRTWTIYVPQGGVTYFWSEVDGP